MKIREIILSWDFFVASLITLVTALIIPHRLSLEFCLSFYNIGITVLSIVFSIFFTALAIIMASSDDDFISFLEEEGDYTILMVSFKITLVMLFVSLIYSIVLYCITSYVLSCLPIDKSQNCIYFLIFEFLFSYSLFATGLSVKDTIMFSQYRAKYISKNKANKKNGH